MNKNEVKVLEGKNQFSMTKLVQLTKWRHPGAPIETPSGPVPYIQWLKMEIPRLCRDGRQIVFKEGVEGSRLEPRLCLYSDWRAPDAGEDWD